MGKLNRCKPSILLLMLLFTSCIPNKKIIYLQGQESGTTPEGTNFNEYRLKVGDIISVEVRSIDPDVAEIFKTQGNLANTGQFDNAADVNYLTGYKVNSEGQVEMPLVGSVNVVHKTIEEAKRIIVTELEKYITDPFVVVRTGGIRYAALGEFKKPGRYTVMQNKLSILEAIANAGDLTEVANRSKVSLIRETPEGPFLQTLDLTDGNLLHSPFYYLEPGDQLYVEPLKVRQTMGFLANAKNLAIIIGGISSVGILIFLANN